jgi:ribosomal protein S18 acetylase RimI-like enzyme
MNDIRSQARPSQVSSVVVDLRLRRATDADAQFCFTLHEAAMGPVVSAVFGAWDHDVQRALHEQWFDPNRVQILEVGDIPVGVLDVYERDDHVYLARIEVLPEWQGRGIGSSVVADIVATAASVRLDVFAVNVRARALYERLGFGVTAAHDARIEMVFPNSLATGTRARPEHPSR